MLLTETQRQQIERDGATAVISNLAQVLRDNHARVLDFMRSVDTNFDGCVSEGEFAYALHTLGLNASPKEVKQVFGMLDPSGDGVIEFAELQDALRNGILNGAPPKPKPLTPAQRERRHMENKAATYELSEMIYSFERQRGLDDPTTKPPPSAADLIDKEKVSRIQEAAKRARESGAPVRAPRGEMMSRMDSVWIKSPLLRPSTAPARVHAAAAAAKRKAALYDFWLLKHRDEIESHARMVELEYAEEKRVRKERVANRRAIQLEKMRVQRDASKLGALERHEPFPMRKEMLTHRSMFLARQTQRAWSQDIVFLPPTVAAREAKVVRERAAADFHEDVAQVYRLE